jgi:hypothetical protein
MARSKIISKRLNYRRCRIAFLHLINLLSLRYNGREQVNKTLVYERESTLLLFSSSQIQKITPQQKGNQTVC